MSTFALHNYPVRDEDILHTGVGPSPPHSTPSTSASSTCAAARIGMSEHSFYEAITHADNLIPLRQPGHRTSPMCGANFVGAYARILAMKLFSQRSVDYFRSAGPRTVATCSSIR